MGSFYKALRDRRGAIAVASLFAAICREWGLFR
jgi:hypothetical protein